MSDIGIKISAIMCSKCDVELIGPMSEIHCPECGYVTSDEDIRLLLMQAHDDYCEERE